MLIPLFLLMAQAMAHGAPIECRSLVEGETAKTPPGTTGIEDYQRAAKAFQDMSQTMMNVHGIENGVFAFHSPAPSPTAPSFYVVTGGDYIAGALRANDLLDRGYRAGSLPIKLGKDSVFLYESSTEEAQWKLAHDALAPFFRPQFIFDTYVPWLKEQAKVIGDQWHQRLRTDDAIEVNGDMEQYSLANAYGALFGETLSRPQYLDFSKLLSIVFKPDPPEESMKIRAGLEAFVNPALQRARDGFDGQDSTASLIHHLLFIQARENLPDSWVMDQIITVYFAGQITTKALLTTAFYQLAVNPGWQDVLRNEYANASDLNKTPNLDNFLNEVLRLYPPVPILQRISRERLQLGDYEIPRYALVILNMYAGFQRSKTFGGNTGEFRPERFNEVSIKKTDLCAFGWGPRVCIGATLATLETKILIGETLKRFDLKLGEEFSPPAPQLDSVLEIQKPLILRIHERPAAGE
jgi:cytochrome P450